jgi:3-phenylpropionate/trans-cinnamate dioxygenase ferredoxin reductase subunit
MCTMSDGIVIAGGGLAGQRAAETLRREGYEGALRIVCAEPHRPYDRPPLSKEVISGRREPDSVCFRPRQWYSDNDIDLVLGVRATGLGLRERRVTLSTGSAIRYDQLLIASGSRPRTLPLFARHENVSELRTVDDARWLRGVLGPGMRLAVVGAGLIGMEVASTARALGAQVTMIEAAPTPLLGVLGPRIGTWFSDLHRAEGVEVITGATVTDVDGHLSARSLRLSNDRVVETDHVLVGVGVEPDIGWLADTGLDHGGVAVDAHGRTRAEWVFAAGDAAATYDSRLGRHVPGSHWDAAGRQAVRAARAMLRLDPGKVELSSFWTDQYGIRIQYLGQARLADSLTIDGEPAERDFTATFSRRGRPVAALLVDRSRSLPHVRKLIDDAVAT